MKSVQLHIFLGWDNSVVIGYLCIIDKAAAYLIAVFQQVTCKWLIHINTNRLQPFLQCPNDILTQIAGIGTGIGQQLMCFI